MSRILKVVAVLCLFSFPAAVARAADPAPRPLKPEDIHRIKTLKDPQVSPDGIWVAYTVTSHDTKEDRQDTDIWMVPRSGGEALRLTASPKGESRPRWSPDGRWLAFLSGREGDESQVWLLDRRGGEGVRVTDYKGGVSDLAWSPDGKRLALIVTDPEPKGEEDEEDEAVEEEEETVKPKPKQEEEEAEEEDEDRPKPIVIRRLQFKRDGEGYLNERRSRLWVFDLESRKGVQVTSGPYDDGQPVWSPDGRSIAFASNRSQEPDANDNSDIFLVEPKAGAALRKLTTWEGNDSSPSFSPDGRSIVYVAGGDPKDVWYDVSTVAVVPVAGGESRELTPTLDRNVDEPRFAPDGQSVLFRVEDGGNVHLVRVPAAGGAVERIVEGELEVEDHDFGPKGELVVLESRSTYPAEVSAVDGMAGGRQLRRLTRANDDFLKGIRLAEVRRLKVKSADGTMVDAFLTLPPSSSPDGPSGKRLPTILRIHGGPVAQYSTGFQLDWQVFAGQGYAVVAANPRGSSGYGREFSRALFGDWGNKDFQDVSAAVDHAVSLGVADPDRLGVGGWSYGGILTNYVVVQTGRFKAAISGASETNYLANYGTDHYQKEWEGELGLPWENTELWIRLSPFFQAKKITTPLLIMCAGADVNVPCLNSEQMYQAVRRLGLETELVIYPDESHSLRRPSFIRHRFERSIAWYDQHLRPEAKKAARGKKK